MTGPWQGVVAALVVVATILAAANVSRGFAGLREPGSLGDLALRFREYDAFRRGHYPNPRLAATPRPARLPYSVYPAYVFPMFVPLFEPGGLRQGAFLVNFASFVSLVALGWFGYRRLRFGGLAVAVLGAMAAAATRGVASGLSCGQFSLGCMGLLVGQLVLLERGRAYAAGICWALAMVKPQIALPFAVLFFTRGCWRGLACGAALLGASTLAACWWTGVSPMRLLQFYAFGQRLEWATDVGSIGVPRFAVSLGVEPLLAQAAGLIVAGVAAAIVWRVIGLSGRSPDALPLAGACGLFGAVVFYHRPYDHVMLAPAVIAAFARVIARPGVVPLTLVAALVVAAWLPGRIWYSIPGMDEWQMIVLVVAGCVLAAWSLDAAHPEKTIRNPAE